MIGTKTMGLRDRNVLLAIILGLVALAFFVGFIVATGLR
jgi:hypothetical protein